ncbi:hypothetical protein KUCAC02_004667 [Chaenocephalus aceratus]|uniref:Uncharacterized protein n=1 Tax=Chaenocephalus aceratus TaxID=36190 RepID=A0ACB9WZY9_CHAAC|nr:hypothetical protein KUCAC02_004667 [Chaenocephalus aceratus]
MSVIPLDTIAALMNTSYQAYHQGSPGGERSSGPIRCQRCREVCKGEVVRVQDTHFHVKCFTCTEGAQIQGDRGRAEEPEPHVGSRDVGVKVRVSPAGTCHCPITYTPLCYP